MVDLLGWTWTFCSWIFYLIKMSTIFAVLLFIGIALYYFFVVRPRRQEQHIVRMKSENKLFRFHSLSFEISPNALINVKVRLSELEKRWVDLGVLNGLQYRIRSIDVGEEQVTITFANSDVVLTIRHEHIEHQRAKSTKNQFFHQYTFIWSSPDYRSRFHDKISLKETGYWYGGATKRTVYWPINEFVTQRQAMVPNDAYKDMFGNVCERYWLSSAGLAFFIDPLVPLFVSMNKITLDFVSEFRRPYQQAAPIAHRFQYKLVQHINMSNLHLFMVDRYLGKPRDMPDPRMIVEPIWSTWAQFKQQINTEKILGFANEIVRHKFPHSQLCIDDNWTPHYGVYQFDAKKFPSPKTLIERLKALNFHVTLWIHPFVSCRSWLFFDYWRRGYLIPLRLIPSLIDLLKERSGIFRSLVNDLLSRPELRSYVELAERFYHRIPFTLPGITLWWNGLAGVIDLSNARAREAFQLSLQRLQTQFSIDSFKFDAGEVNWLPIFGEFADRSCRTLANETDGHVTSPALFPHLFAHLAYEIDPDRRLQEVRVGFRTQALPMFVRIIDKDSTWSYNNGLRSLLPSVFNLSLLGYPFILPDMVGGNGYGLTITQTRLPQRELYIRWLQLNVLLPAIQISFPPWLYGDDEVIRIARKCFDLRQRYRSVLLSAAEESVQLGLPMIRPLWFRDPYDHHAHLCDSEYLLGDDLLVAPVLDENVRQTKIYFPQGQWKCIETNRIYDGNQTVDYPVTLETIPIFERCDISDLASE